MRLRWLVHELLGLVCVETTMIYTLVLNKGGKPVTSPMDKLIGLTRVGESANLPVKVAIPS